MTRALITLLACATISLALGGVASGDTIDYGSFVGNDYTFSVIEDSITDSLPLFGAPSGWDDTLQFLPTNFESFSQEGDLDTTDSTMKVTIQAHAGKTIDTLTIFEKGTYALTGTGTADTFVSVTGPGWVRVEAVNGQSINPIVESMNLVFNPGEWSLPADSEGTWQGGVTVDVAAIVLAHGYQGSATRVWVTWDDDLFSMSEIGTSADIIKTEADIYVPEPATLALLLAGSGLVIRRMQKAGRKN